MRASVLHVLLALPLLLALVGACDRGATGAAPAAGTGAPPHVVLIVMDTTGARRLSLYGHDRPTTPRLEQLAAESVVYEHAFSAAPWTLPSHASLFTGLYPVRHWATYEHPRLEPSHRTLATILHERGYRTVGVSNAGWVGTNSGLAAGFEHFVKVSAWDKTKRWYTLKTTRATPDGERTDVFHLPWEPDMDDAGARRTVRLVEELLDAGAGDARPLFLFVNFVEPHLPYEPPRAFAERFLPAGVTYEEALAVPHNAYAHHAGVEPISPEQFALLEALHDAEIACLDARIGELVQRLRDRGLLDDALLVVTADHGEQIGHHGFLGHNLNVYDELLHVPLLVRCPGRYDGGVRVETPVQTLDVFATVLSLAAPELLDGATDLDAQVLPARSAPRDAGRTLVSEYARPLARLEQHAALWPDRDMSRYDRRLEALRVGPWKLIAGSDGRHELYDVRRDPHETTDLAAAHPDVLAELLGRLEQWLELRRTATGAALQDGALPAMDPEVERELRELGYIR